MAITTQDGLISARANKRRGASFRRLSVVNMAAGQLCSLYRAGSAGAQFSQPAIPTAAAVPTKALSFNFPTPSGADTTYLDSLDINAQQAGRVVWLDRVFHIGGLNGTLATAQTVNSQTPLPSYPIRGAAAEELEWFLEWYADTGATAVNATVAVTYTDAGTANLVVALAATMRIGRLLSIVPAQGKVIASVQSVTLSATTGAAGNFGVTAGNRISASGMSVMAANIAPQPRQAILRAVPDNTCLMAMVECTTTSTGDVSGELVLVEG